MAVIGKWQLWRGDHWWWFRCINILRGFTNFLTPDGSREGIFLSSVKNQVVKVEYQVKTVEYRVELVEYQVKIVEYQVKLVEWYWDKIFMRNIRTSRSEQTV